MPSTAYCAISVLMWMLILGGIIYALFRAATSIYNKVVGEKNASIGFGDIGKRISEAAISFKLKAFGQKNNLGPKNLRSTNNEVCVLPPRNLQSAKGAKTKVPKAGNKSGGERDGSGRPKRTEPKEKKVTKAPKGKKPKTSKFGKKPEGKTGTTDAEPGSFSDDVGRGGDSNAADSGEPQERIVTGPNAKGGKGSNAEGPKAAKVKKPKTSKDGTADANPSSKRPDAGRDVLLTGLKPVRKGVKGGRGKAPKGKKLRSSKGGTKPKGFGTADGKPDSKSDFVGGDQDLAGNKSGFTKAPKGKKLRSSKGGTGDQDLAGNNGGFAKGAKGKKPKDGKKPKGKIDDDAARGECAEMVKCLEKCIGDDKE